MMTTVAKQSNILKEKGERDKIFMYPALLYSWSN
jgi:hypothetical protein